eukprot:COSAG01_NODE_34250_length_550_cov_19.350333_1_plen_73_part_10
MMTTAMVTEQPPPAPAAAPAPSASVRLPQQPVRKSGIRATPGAFWPHSSCWGQGNAAAPPPPRRRAAAAAAAA